MWKKERKIEAGWLHLGRRRRHRSQRSIIPPVFGRICRRPRATTAMADAFVESETRRMPIQHTPSLTWITLS